MMPEMIFGLDTNELLNVKRKLDILGVELKDITEFLDRSEVQLFAEMKVEIKSLQKTISDARKVLA